MKWSRLDEEDQSPASMRYRCQRLPLQHPLLVRKYYCKSHLLRHEEMDLMEWRQTVLPLLTSRAEHQLQTIFQRQDVLLPELSSGPRAHSRLPHKQHLALFPHCPRRNSPLKKHHLTVILFFRSGQSSTAAMCYRPSAPECKSPVLPEVHGHLSPIQIGVLFHNDK